MKDHQYDEPEEWGLIRQSVRKILDAEATLDDVRNWDANYQYPEHLFRILADQGYLAMPFEPEWGGASAGPQEMIVVAEELGRRGMDIAAGFGLSVFLGLAIQSHGTVEQKSTLLPEVLAGTKRLSVSITEPNAGSDAAAIVTAANPTEGGYLIRGQKVFTTGAGLPNTTLVMSVKTRSEADGESRVSLFLVPADSPGVTLNRLDTVGRHILGTYEVFLEDVFVPEDALLGPLGSGWSVLRHGLTLERLFTCGAYVGGFETVLDLTIDYVRTRKQFKQTLGEFQAISHPLADSYAALEASRLLTYAAARKVAEGRDARMEVSVAKLFVTETYQRAADHAMQAFGGYGYMQEYDIHRFWKDARIATISAGTSQIQREIISRGLGLRP
jgi:alkylation response protein AidB-like acyl-CoA dehydrogenase